MNWMWADTETDKDFLNYGELAEVVALMLTDPKLLPLSIGVSGGWGTGKSSFLRMVEARLPAGGKDADGRQYIVIHYDAWLYQGYDDARAALMDRIGERLLAEAKERKDNQPLIDKGLSLIRRTRKLRALALAGDVALTLGGIPTLGFLTKGASALENMLDGAVDAKDITEARDAVKKAREELKGLVRPEAQPSPPQEIEEFREEFSDLLKELNAVLVVFIDNLDRCLPTQIIHTLEALRLFLFMGNSAFCVAADEDMVRGAIRKHFEGIEGNHVRDYLDKLIQVPVRVPRLGVPEVTSYLMLLFAEIAPEIDVERLDRLRDGMGNALREAWRGDLLAPVDAARLLSDSPSQTLIASFELAERMAPLLVNSSAINGNPRIIKRLLNTVRLRARLAEVRHLDADETMIAKLALFERCMGERAALALYSDIQGAEDGRSPRLQEMEKAGTDEGAFKTALPQDWTGPEQERFLREWVGLRPSLADVDLRGVSYLSRDTVMLAGRRRGLSQVSAEALKTLSAVERLPSPTAHRTALGIPTTERAEVMEALLTAMRRHKDWKQQPAEINGALVLARLDPELDATLRSFLREAGGTKTPPWINLLLKADTAQAAR
ncbi:MAG: NTPase KAP [Azospirillum brasilense]|nr:MAG: NTPase KAP [Azospirillum brasilense]